MLARAGLSCWRHGGRGPSLHNKPMTRFLKGLALVVLAGLLLLGVVAVALGGWVGSDDFRERLEREAGAALGLPVRLAAVEVSLWPLPAVAVSGIGVQSTPPLTLERLELRPGWAALLMGRLEIATLVLRKAVLPQQAVDAVLLSLQKKKQLPAGRKMPRAQKTSLPEPADPADTSDTAVTDWLPRRTVLDGVTWVNLKGARTTVDAEVRLGEDHLPDDASLKVVEGALKGLQASLRREDAGATAAGTGWALRVDVGGGKVEGRLGMQQAPAAQGGVSGWLLQGQLETQGVEVAALTAPNRPLTGRLEASTSLSARAATTAGLVEALQTRTRFSVRNAVLQGLDLASAVRTVGLSRGGQTALDTLAGQVESQGRSVQLNNLVASSGVLSATGQVSVSPAQALSGRVSVNLAGTIGVPLAVSGTLASPEVSLSRGALFGAAIGTAVMPGVGTGAGMELGERLGQGLKGLFGK